MGNGKQKHSSLTSTQTIQCAVNGGTGGEGGDSLYETQFVSLSLELAG